MKPILLALTFLPLPLCPAADPPKPPAKPYQIVTVDRASADADYGIQGEYSGKIEGAKTGIQVVALSGGKFDVVLYRGGLPGDGWAGNKALVDRGNAERTDGRVRLRGTGRPEGVGRSDAELGLDYLFVDRPTFQVGTGVTAGSRLGGGPGVFLEWSSED